MSLPANIRVNTGAPFPAQVKGSGPIGISKANGIWTLLLSLLGLTSVAPGTDPATQQILVYNTALGIWQKSTLAAAVLALQTEQDIAGGAVVNVAVNDGMIKVAKTVGSATQVILPLASTKIGPVTISDFKGDAGTNNITVTLTGTDKFPGNLTQWVISGDGGSITAKPLKDGSGYAI